jgi:hypothetical protein
MIMMPFPHMKGLILLPFLLLVQRGASVSVITSPSNDSLPQGNGTFLLANSQHPYSTPINLAPLTRDLASLNPGDFRVRPLFFCLFVLFAQPCSVLSAFPIRCRSR